MSMWHYTDRTHEDEKGGNVKVVTPKNVDETKEEKPKKAKKTE